MPESLACSLGILLLRKWGRCVVIGSRIDSGGTYRIIVDASWSLQFCYYLKTV